MALVTYNPVEGAAAPSTTSQFGYDFTAGTPVEVTDEKHLAKFAGHPFFAVEKVSNDPNQLRAVHNGGGRFIIVRGDKDHKVMEGLTKEDAHAFNELTDAERALYVESAQG